MTGRACGCILIVYPDYPIAFVHVHFVSESLIKDAMLRFLEYLNLRVVRTQVTLSAGVRSSCLFLGETMSSMARGTATFTSIRVDPSDTGVWPSGRVKLSVLEHFDV
jgi:hypothetical protein